MEKIKIDIATLFERVSQMDTRLTSEIREIKDNHIAHLSESISNLNSQIAKLRDQIKFWAGGLATLVFIIGLALTFIRLFTK